MVNNLIYDLNLLSMSHLSCIVLRIAVNSADGALCGLARSCVAHPSLQSTSALAVFRPSLSVGASS
jgi:hypothetical protein